MSHRYLSLIVPLALALGLAAPAGASAPGTTLSLHGVSKMLTDSAHDQTFVTGDPDVDSSIVVLNGSGAVVKTITGESGAGGMVLDGSDLYVSRCGWATIDVIDTTTDTQVDSFSAPGLAATSCDIGLAGGRIWYITGNGEGGTLKSVTLDPSHTAYTTTQNLNDALFVSAPASAPDTLVEIERGVSPGSVNVFDVTAAQPTVTTSHMMSSTCGTLTDAALTADAATLFLTCTSPYAVQSFALSDLTSATGTYSTGPYPNAVALSGDGAKIAAGAKAYYDKDLFVFPVGSGTPGNTVDFGTSYNTILAARGLAFSADGSHVFALTTNDASTNVTLHVESGSSNPALPVPSIGITAGKTTIVRGQAVKVTAQLGHWAVGRHVSIYRQPYGGARTLVGTGTVDSTGTWSVAVRPTIRTTYTAQFDGDATYEAATSAGRVILVRATVGLAQSGFYRTSGAYRLYHYRAACWTHPAYCPQFAAHTTPAYAGSAIKFTVQQHTSTGWHTLTSGSVGEDASGVARAYWRYTGSAWIGRLMRIRATWGGNVQNAPAGSAYAYFRITK